MTAPDPAPATREQIDAPTAIAEEVCICGQYLNTRGDKAGPELCLANKHTAPATEAKLGNAVCPTCGAVFPAPELIAAGAAEQMERDARTHWDALNHERAAGAAEERQRITDVISPAQLRFLAILPDVRGTQAERDLHVLADLLDGGQ